MYSANRARDLITIFCRFNHMQYKIGFDPERFVVDFDSTVEDFLIVNMPLSDEFQVVAFLYKFSNTTEPGTLYASFYTNMMSTSELKKYDVVKKEFLMLDYQKFFQKGEKHTNSDYRSNGNDKKLKQDVGTSS